jgi:predicted dehydrogenase
MAQLNVALIGYAFMGRAHSNAYRQVGRFFTPKHLPRMKVLCGRTPAAVKTAADQLGWEETSTDWREVVRRKDIDIVDIVTPATATPRSRSKRRRRARWCSARSRSPTR